MSFTESDLRAASAAGLLDATQLDRLIGFLCERAVSTGPAVAPPRFDFAHLLWYAGALIVMTAMGLFSTLAFSQMFYAYAFQVSWLGAEDGLVGIPRPVVPGATVSSLRGFHGYLLVVVTLSALVLWRIVR